jgi:hypothetical protein
MADSTNRLTAVLFNVNGSQKRITDSNMPSPREKQFRMMKIQPHCWRWKAVYHGSLLSFPSVGLTGGLLY